MKLIVGLGNPGERYAPTRHNAGFWLVERFAARTGTVLRKDAKFQALVGRHEASGAWLVLPQNFMNASGRPVQMLASFFKIAPGEILVAHDELDFPPGTVRLKEGGGVAGHNGLKDVSARLGTHGFWRIRIGIGHPGDRHLVTDYVLHKPSQEDRSRIDEAIDRALDVLPAILAGDTQNAMMKLHTEAGEAARAAPVAPRRGKKAAAAEGEKPDPGSAPAAGEQAQQSHADSGAGEAAATDKPAGRGRLGSFLRRILPDTDPGSRK